MIYKLIAATEIDECKIFLQDEEGTVVCMIQNGDCVSSLGVAEDFGTLEGSNGEVYEIDPRTVARIRTWAEENGY